MAYTDSLDKIITTYFACVSTETFTYKGKTYEPKPLHISPMFLRGFKCPPMCGGCCPRFSLDYIESEEKPYDLQERYVEFNGNQIKMYSDTQEDHKNHKCKNLNLDDGRCNIHGKQPFSCDFELIRFIQFNNTSKRDNMMIQRLFGRGWNMKTVQGTKGALCEITDVTDESIRDNIRKLKRLREWCNYFKLNHKIDPIIEWAEAALIDGTCDKLILDASGNVKESGE